MKEQLLVIKIGGNVIDSEGNLRQFLKDFAALPQKKILVHGGGKLATQLAKQLDLPQQMVDGRRITDAETLKLVIMVYAGLINKNIVAQLQANGCNAIGISGADGNLLEAHKRHHAGMDYGFVGDVDRVNDTLIQTLMAANLNPVVAPITHDAHGQLLNTNADTIAQEIAQAASGPFDTQLIYCFEKAGVLMDVNDEQSAIPVVDKDYFEHLKANKIIFEGMLPKLTNAFAAIGRGVGSVTIGSWSQLTKLAIGQAGTKIINN
ncbi:MAG: acetylglutamate kinase [Edaphocola sp.]